MASRRKRGPVALRHQLWLDLPLSTKHGDRTEMPVNSGMYGVGGNARFGSVAVVQTNSTRMAGLEWKADTLPGRMTAPTNSGRSGALNPTEMIGS
jgi:hypothetical protein